MNPTQHLRTILLIFIWILFLPSNAAKKPRIAIAGIAIECSTFSPARSDLSSFKLRRSEELLNYYPFLQPDSVLRSSAEWLPVMHARAIPGGIVTRDCYEIFCKEIIEGLQKSLPLDGLFFDIHGAMSVEGIPDPEGDLIIRIRKVIGNRPIVSTSMDLHGSVSKRLAEHSDLITCYRMAPHEDAIESRRRAVENMVTRLERNQGKPKYKAWVYVPILLPGEKTSTRIDPGKSLYRSVPDVANQEGVDDAAIWISYAWADEPRNHGVVVVTGDDRKKVKEGAEYLARKFWNVRKQFEFVAPTASLEICLEKALSSNKRPYFISDMGDNPTAGGAGDVTWTLHELFKNKELRTKGRKRLVYASIPGPELIEEALKVGVGGYVKAKVGGMVDHRYAPPLLLDGTVKAIVKRDENTEVVVEHGSMLIIVTAVRKPYHYIKDFSGLGIDLQSTDIVMVKLGYLTEELYDVQADWMMALTRGGVDQDLQKLPYKGIHRPMFPLDDPMKEPTLKAEFIPIHNQ